MDCPVHECSQCGMAVVPRRQNYRYLESGLSNVILQGVEIAECESCGNEDVILPRLEKIQRAIAQALSNSPIRLSGEQIRFLRNHLGMTGEGLGKFLHTDRTKISKWEHGEDRMGPTADRLLRLLVAILDEEIRPTVITVAEHLPLIEDSTEGCWELHIDVESLAASFLKVSVETSGAGRK